MKPWLRHAWHVVKGASPVLVVDLLTKGVAESLLHSSSKIVVAPMLNLRLGYNKGVSFGLFPAETAGAVAVLVAFQGLAITALTLFAVRSDERLERTALGLIVGGALGNLADRVTDGVVTDFIDFHAAGWHWPAFNVADIGITVGAVLLVVNAIRTAR